jgi:hypothetical protein
MCFKKKSCNAASHKRHYLQKFVPTSFIRAARALSDGETKQLHFDASVPDEKTDRCTVLFWNAGAIRNYGRILWR